MTDKAQTVFRKHRHLLGPVFFLMGWAHPGILMAQETPASPTVEQDTSHDKKPERIEVTGSRIKRSQVETSSSVIVITHEDIERSGVSNLGELVRNSSSQTTGNFAGNQGYVRNGAQTADLFGLGAGRTLVLLDGERLPRDSSLSGTNLSTIPLAMIERVEYLTGSKSAVYGTDAVAGVMNIVTRKTLDGTVVETNLRVPQHPGGNKIGLNVSSGVQVGDKTHLIVSGGYEREQAILTKNRAISFGEGKFANSRGAAAPGTFSYRITPPGGTASLWAPSPNCTNTSDLRGPGDPDRGVFCVGNSRNASYSQLLNASERGFFATRGEYELSSDTSMHSYVSYVQNVAKANSGNYFSGTNFLTSRGQTLSSDIVNNLNLGITAPAGSRVEVTKLDNLAPDRIKYNKDQAYGGIVTLDTKLTTNWSGNASLSHFTTENHRWVNNVIDRKNYARIMHGITFNETSGAQNPTVPPQYVIIDPNRNTALFGQMTDTMNAAERNGVTGLSVNIGRDITDLPGGKLALSVGVDSRVETYIQTPDPLDSQFFQKSPRFTGTEAISGNGSRSVNSLYAELLAPVLKTVNLDAALRFDNYSDFGSATNYSLGGKWGAASFLTLRGTTGTSYRAPELNSIHQKGGGGYVSIRDEAWCANQAASGNPCIADQKHQIFNDSPGNKNLKPEVGRTYTVGMLVEPAPDLYFSADYVGLFIRDEFSVRPTQDIVDDYFAGRSTGDNIVTIDPATKSITSISTPNTNIGWTAKYLIQMVGGYKWALGPVKFDYKSDSTRTLSSKSERADKSIKQYNGIEGNPRWRWNNSLTSMLGDWSWTLSSMTIGKQEPDPENGKNYAATYYNDQVDQFTQYNTSVGWKYAESGTLLVGVNDIADKIGGYYRTGNFTGGVSGNASLYSSSLYGRSWFMNLTQRF